MDRLNYNEIISKQVKELIELIEVCIKGKTNIVDAYIKAAKLDERYTIYSENLQIIRLAMQHKIGF